MRSKEMIKFLLRNGKDEFAKCSLKYCESVSENHVKFIFIFILFYFIFFFNFIGKRFVKPYVGECLKSVLEIAGKDDLIATPENQLSCASGSISFISFLFRLIIYIYMFIISSVQEKEKLVF
jgi:hypothetical protein